MTSLSIIIETWGKRSALLISCAVLLVSIAKTTYAQTAPDTRTDAQKRASNQSVTVTQATTATRTSPFAPPDDSDHSFSTDDAPKLDTGCIFRSSGPIIFNIEIKRFVGRLKADGTLADADKLINAGAISPTVKLIMPGFDVDSNGGGQGIQPERDRVSINGQEVGFLQGQNDRWILNSFEVDIRKIKFAERGVDGGPPTGGVNQIRIDIDTANADEQWCTSVDWGSAGFRALSPIILIHGNRSDDDFFVRQGFTQELDAKALAYDNKVFGDTRANPTANRISRNAVILNNNIPKIAASFGAKTIHLVAHSKGGLDARAYLALFQSQHDDDFKVISLTTLSTPHDGSVLADVLIEREAALLAGSVDFVGFPLFTNKVAETVAEEGIDEGKRDLTTGFVHLFNNTNVDRLRGRGIDFNTVAADADLNSNGSIDDSPDEFLQIRTEGNLDNTFKVRFGINAMYKILRQTQSIAVTTSDICVPFTSICHRTTTLTSVPNPTLLGNDLLVTTASGQGARSIQSLTRNTRLFVGADGRNHSDVANRGVAQRVLPWLFAADKSKGGLR